jgi:hypothetical protein
VSCYGDPGETCRVDGCGTILRQSNPYDVCSRCLGRGIKGRKRPPRRGGVPATACSEAAPTASLVPRRVSQEAIELAAEERRKYGEAKAAIVELMDDGDWRSSTKVAKDLGIPVTTAKYHLQSMTENGKLVSDGKGGKGYRWRKFFEGAKALDHALAEYARGAEEEAIAQANSFVEEAPTAPPASAQGPDPEPPAKAAADPGPHHLRELPPFAGLATMATEWFGPQSIEVLRSHEMLALMYLEEMDDEARDRILDYADNRWPRERDTATRVVHMHGTLTDSALAHRVLDLIDGWNRTRSRGL